MKKIVQLDEYEYNKLAELAKLNEEQINQKAADLWEKKGVAEIEINIETGHDTRHVFRIDSVNKTRFLWMLVAASGWAVAAVTLLWYFTK